MGRQYVVTYFPDATQVVEAVGPFRSRERAQAIKDRLEAAIDPDGGDEVRTYGAGVQLVVLGTADEAIAEHALSNLPPEGGEQRG